MSDSFTLVHISDLHFHRVPRKPTQWLSKRGLGALNLIFRRARVYPPARAERLVRQLDRMDWGHLVITGDLTQLALEEEFELARRALAPLLARGQEMVTVLPGNHDRYVAEPGGQDYFRAYFGEYFGEGEIATRDLTPVWRLAAWDSTAPTRAFKATGQVSHTTLQATEAWLAGLPSQCRVILANHYPVRFAPPHRYKAHHDLENWREVQSWISAQGISLYLHGHVHANWVLDFEEGGRRQTHVNSASSTRVPHPGERSAYHRIVLSGSDWEIQPQALE